MQGLKPQYFISALYGTAEAGALIQTCAFTLLARGRSFVFHGLRSSR